MTQTDKAILIMVAIVILVLLFAWVMAGRKELQYRRRQRIAAQKQRDDIIRDIRESKERDTNVNN